MSDTNEERPRKYRMLFDICKEECERRVANLGNVDSESNSSEDDSDEFSLKKHRRKSKAKRSGAKRKTSLLKGSGNKRLKVVSKCNLGKRGRKTSSSVRCEASTSGTKKVSLSRGSKNNCSVSALAVKKAQLAQPAMSFSQSLLTSLNDEIVSALQLISLSS